MNNSVNCLTTAQEINKKEERESDFHIKDGKLFYKGKMVGNSKKQPGFPRLKFIEESVGSGHNAMVFKVKHTYLDGEQIVKIYFPHADNSYGKIQLETQKNANVEVEDLSAIVYDAGEYTYPIPIHFSIMRYVQNLTFKKWCKLREDRFVRKLTRYKYIDILDENVAICIHNTLNFSAGYLKAVMELYHKGSSHGDMNPGNILLEVRDGEYYDFSKIKSFDRLIPDKVRLIDMGTSRLLDNHPQDAAAIRDTFHIYNTLRKALKIFFEDNSSLKAWLNIEIQNVDKEQYGVDYKLLDKNEQLISPFELASDLFRLVGVLSCIMKCEYDYYHPDEIDPEEIEPQEKVMDCYENFYFYTNEEPCFELFDTCGDVKQTTELFEEANSVGRLVDWDKVEECDLFFIEWR